MNKTRAALYCRVSTDQQDNEHQASELREYAARRRWEDPKVYSDVIEGPSETRPALDALLRDMRAGKLDVVCVVKLDRLGRSLIHLATVLAEFQRLHVALICVSQGIDTSYDNPAARFQLQVLGAVAEFERSLIRERTIAGLKTARARGKRLGRKPLDPALRDRAAALKAEGKTLRVIAAELGVSLGSVANLLAQPVAA